MQLDSQKIIGLANDVIGVRNSIRQAIAVNDQVVDVPAVPASEGNPGKPASKRSTAQLPNANNNLFVTVTNLIGHLRNIGGSQDDVMALEKALNAPLVPAPVGTGATATASQPTAKATTLPGANAKAPVASAAVK